jgi:hypothetical protein
LLFWETLNDVTVSGIAHLGSGAARIGAGSSITFRRPLFPGTRVVMTGTRFTEGNPVAAAGLSFWNADGERLLDASIPLASTPVYEDFHFFANVPEGTAEVTMWIRNGPEGAVTVDDLGLIHVFEGPVPDPVGPDTGFEDGLPAPWAGNGSVTLTDEALSGTRAARLDGRAFLETSRAAGPGETWRFSGLSRISGPGTIREGGLVFRDRNGQLLGETTTILPAGETDSAFTIEATAPASTVAVSAWIRQGGPGGLTLDDLTLGRLPGSAPPPSAAGVHGSAHVFMAGGLTRDLVAALEPDRFTDRAANRMQPDLNIRGAKGGRFGEGIVNATGAGQTLWVRATRRFTSFRFETGLKNAAPALRDGAVLAGSPGNRAITLSWFENDPAGSNRSAEIIAGTYETPAVLPGEGRSLHAQLRRTKAYRGSRFLFRLRARSSADASAVDEVRGGLR